MGKRINNQTTFVLRRANFHRSEYPYIISPPRPSLSHHSRSPVFITVAKIKWQNGDDALYFVHYSLPLHSLLISLPHPLAASFLQSFLFIFCFLGIGFYPPAPLLPLFDLSASSSLFFSVPCLASSSGGIDRNPEVENAIGTCDLSRTLSVSALQRESEA